MVPGCRRRRHDEPDDPSVSALLTQAISDADQGGWVHEVIHGSADGQTFSDTNDVGETDGRQVIQEGSGKDAVSPRSSSSHRRPTSGATPGPSPPFSA
jgi:hypothetical protein